MHFSVVPDHAKAVALPLPGLPASPGLIMPVRKRHRMLLDEILGMDRFWLRGFPVNTLQQLLFKCRLAHCPPGLSNNLLSPPFSSLD